MSMAESCSWQRCRKQQNSGVVGGCLRAGQGVPESSSAMLASGEATQLRWTLPELWHSWLYAQGHNGMCWPQGPTGMCWLLHMGNVDQGPRGGTHRGRAGLGQALSRPPAALSCLLVPQPHPSPCQRCRKWACFAFCHFSIVTFHAGLGKKG